MTEKKSQSGNALVYVLVAIALFAALSFTLTRSTDTDEAAYLSDDEAELYASEMVSFTAQAKNAVDQMMFSNSDIDELDFILPSDAAFDTGSNIHKVFHPAGGGLNFKAVNSKRVIDATGGVYVVKKDVEWTRTTGTDVILSFYRLKPEICTKLAAKIDNTQHSYVGSSLTAVFTDQADGDTLDSTFCPTCEDKFIAVIENPANSSCTFYMVLADR